MEPAWVKITQGFNSRTPKGCDCKHANFSISTKSFNSRTPKGCDVTIDLKRKSIIMFQFTHP